MSCDSAHSGDITRDGFYRSLALVAVAQLGREPEERSLLHYAESGEREWEGGRGEARGGILRGEGRGGVYR